MALEGRCARRSRDLVRWLIPVTIKFPRQQRFVLAARIQHNALAFHEQIIDAGLSAQPEPILRRADVTLAALYRGLALANAVLARCMA